MYNTDLQML